jgi:hypothetical protein
MDRELPVAPRIIRRFTRDSNAPLLERLAPLIHIWNGEGHKHRYARLHSGSDEVIGHRQIGARRTSRLQGQLSSGYLKQGVLLSLHESQMKPQSLLIKTD